MLKYIGSGFIPGIPARDLTDEEVKELGGAEFLIDTGLYEKVGSQPNKEQIVLKKDGE